MTKRITRGLLMNTNRGSGVICEHCQTEHKCPVDWSDYGDRAASRSVVFGVRTKTHLTCTGLLGRWTRGRLGSRLSFGLHKEALGKLERGELENREDNNSMKLEDCE